MESRKLHAARAKAAERRVQAFELRKRGMTFREIGRACGVSEAQAHADITYRLQELADLEKPIAEDVRKLEVERLDKLWLAVQPRAEQGEPAAIATALRVMERRALLLGLDAPKRQEITGTGGGPVVVRWGANSTEP